MLQSLIGSFGHCPVYGVKGYFTSQFIAKIATMNVNLGILKRKQRFDKQILKEVKTLKKMRGEDCVDDEPGHVPDSFPYKQ